MAKYHKEKRQFTIAQGETPLHFLSTWFPGPNQGPVFYMADPSQPHEGQVLLVTFDLAKGRFAPNPPKDNGEVFYRFKVRNESDHAVNFDIESVTFKEDFVP